MIGSPAKLWSFLLEASSSGNQWQQSATVYTCFSHQRYSIEETTVFVRFRTCSMPLSWYFKMCTCRLPLSYLSWENMQNWNLRFPAFVAPNKRAEFATFASAGNSRKALLLCQLKVTSSKEVQSTRDVSYFVKLSQFNVC